MRLILPFIACLALAGTLCGPAPDAAAQAEDSPVAPTLPLAGVPPSPPSDWAPESVLPEEYACETYSNECWTFQALPDSIIYKSYLAGAKESRMAAKMVYEIDDGWFWDATLGARVGVFRYGTRGRVRPQGFQLDVEGSAQVRLDPVEEVDVRATDYRVGFPLTIGYGEFGQHQTKIAYYHLSSHLGDEFLLKRPNFDRLNYARDVIVLGHSMYLSHNVRVYGEIGYAFYHLVSEPWEAQVGLDYAPTCATGLRGAPFFAINGHFREETNWGGNLNVQVGWAWRGDANARLFRVGINYYNGESWQFSLFDWHEQLIGVGIWYDF